MAFTTCQRISSLLLLAILTSCPDKEILCHDIQYKSFSQKRIPTLRQNSYYTKGARHMISMNGEYFTRQLQKRKSQITK
jgi:hypothetical protein